MQRFFLGLTVVVLTVSSSSAQASDFWNRVHLDFHRMNCWPEPFVHADRELVRAPFIAMTNSGWQLQNTLSHHFFDSESQELTRAGKLKLQWILTQAPTHRRTVFVVRSLDRNATDMRLASVHSNMQRFILDGDGPEVLVSDTIPSGGSGDYFDNVDRQLKSSVPVPRLPPRGGVTDVGSGG